MSLSKLFKTDSELERKGVWLEFPNEADEPVTEFLLARTSRQNPDYTKVADRVWKPHRRANELGLVNQQQTDRLNREVFAEGAILAWKNVKMADVTGNDGEDGRPLDEGYIDYSPENAVKLLTRLPELYTALLEVSLKRETFQRVQKEDDAKNLPPSSRTSSNKAKSKRA